MKKVISLILLSILFLSACNQFREEEDGLQATETPGSVEAAVATAMVPTPLPIGGSTILAEGALATVNPQAALSFSRNGRLLEMQVQAGDRVAAGDLIATLDDQAIQEALVDGELAVRQAENSLAQAELNQDNLLNWEPDEAAVAQAEANLAAAEAGLDNAQTQDSVAGNSATSARVNLEQAQEALANAQGAYETAFDPGREWELFIDDPSCRTGEQYPFCTGPPYSDKIKAERDGAERAVAGAEDQLTVAQANYSLALAGVNTDNALSAEANIASAQQALAQALKGPQAQEIDAAQLQVDQAQLALEQAKINLEKTNSALEDTQLVAPWAGTILSVDVSPGSLVGSGSPIVTLVDTAQLQFQTSNLSERDLAQVEPGQEVTISLKAYPNDTLTGRVQRIAPLASGTIGDAATFTVIILLDGTDLELLPGMTGRAEIKDK